MNSLKTSDLFPGRKDLRISLTTHCNYNCFFCHAEGNDKPWAHLKESVPSIEEIGKLIGAAVSYGAQMVRFSGGEPATYLHILDLLPKTREWVARFPSVKRWGLNTNGAAFVSNTKLRQALLDSALNDLVVGMDSVSEYEKSKPSSTIGMTGAALFEGLKSLGEDWLHTPGRMLKVNVVYTGRHDENRVVEVIAAARSIKADVGVIELGGTVSPDLRDEFETFRSAIAARFGLIPRRNELLDQIHLADESGREPIRFYQNHCKDVSIETNGKRRGCNASRNIHLRIGPTKNGLAAIPCPFEAAKQMIPITRNGNILPGGFEDAMQYNGRGPDWAKNTKYE